MEVNEVESLVRDVIVHFGLPFTLLFVIASPPGWNIVVRAGTGGIVRLTVAGGRPSAVRSAIHEALEAG